MSNALKETQNTEAENNFNISVAERREIKPTIPTEVRTLKDLCADVNDLFSVYKDYKGCRIMPVIVQGTGQIQLETILYFQQGASAEGISEAFVANSAPTAKSNATVIDRLRARENLSKGKKYSITEDGKNGLDKFIDDRAKKNADWTKTCVAENFTDGVYGAPRSVLISVKHVSILNIIKTIYDTKDEEGNTIWYQITPIRQISPEPNPNWLIQLSSIKEKDIAEIANDIGWLAPSATSQIMVAR